MPAPTNTSALTATELGPLPNSIIQDVYDSGTTYTVWYKYTAVAGEDVLGIWAFGDLTTYRPTINVYTGPAAAPVTINLTALNKRVQFQVTVGTLYLFEIVPNSGNPHPASLTISGKKAPHLTVPVGAILVNDDVGGPAAIVSATTGNVIRFKNSFAAGEGGDVLEDGRILMDDVTASNLKYYSALLDSSTSIVYPAALSSGSIAIRTNNKADKFYISNRGTNPDLAKATTILSSGLAGPTVWDLELYDLKALASSNDETVLYYAGGPNQGDDTPIKRFDIVNNIPMVDFLSAFAGYTVFDILVLSDDSIVIGYIDRGTFDEAEGFFLGNTDVVIKRYNSDAELLNSYEQGSDQHQLLPHLAYAIDNPDSFWFWNHPISIAGISRFQEIQVSDGTVLTLVETPEYEIGVYSPVETATPLADFGNSNSCPFLIMRVKLPGPGGIYFIHPNKTNDTIYTSINPTTTDDFKIP